MPSFNQLPQPSPNVRPANRAPAEPVSGSPYDFITHPSTDQPKQASGLPGGNMLLYIAGGGILLVIILAIVFSALGGSSSSPVLTQVAQQQAELARVADLNYGEIHSADIKKFAITTQLTATSEQTEYLQYLGSKGVKITPKQIALGINADTDKSFEAAKSSGTLDSTIKATLKAELQDYQLTLQAAYKASDNSDTKALLKTFFEEVTLLLEQVKAPAS